MVTKCVCVLGLFCYVLEMIRYRKCIIVGRFYGVQMLGFFFELTQCVLVFFVLYCLLRYYKEGDTVFLLKEGLISFFVIVLWQAHVAFPMWVFCWVSVIVSVLCKWGCFWFCFWNGFHAEVLFVRTMDVNFRQRRWKLGLLRPTITYGGKVWDFLTRVVEFGSLYTI